MLKAVKDRQHLKHLFRIIHMQVV